MNLNDPHVLNPASVILDKLRQEFEGFVDRARSSGERTLDALGLRQGRFAPPVDLSETTEEVTIRVDLPGVDPNSVDVALSGNMLTLRGTRPVTEMATGETLHLQERSTGEFERTIPLPSPVDPSQVTAHAHNGVLLIRLPKKESAKVHQIKVQVPPSAPSEVTQAGM